MKDPKATMPTLTCALERDVRVELKPQFVSKVKKLFQGDMRPSGAERIANVPAYTKLLKGMGHEVGYTTINKVEMGKVLIKNAELNHNLAKKKARFKKSSGLAAGTGEM